MLNNNLSPFWWGNVIAPHSSGAKKLTPEFRIWSYPVRVLSNEYGDERATIILMPALSVILGEKWRI
jgi:hypothetical protein